MYHQVESILPFSREPLYTGSTKTIRTAIPSDVGDQIRSENRRIPLLRFIVNPAQASAVLVRLSIAGLERSNGFVSAALLSQISLNEIVDADVPIEAEFRALENGIVLDCGIVCRLKRAIE
jgi:hypothetical protein